MRGELSKARRHSWIYMETESGQHQRRTRGIGAGGQIDIYLNVKQMQQFPGLLVKFIVGRIYCFCARLECTDRKPLVKQFIEEACVQMWPMKYIKITMMTKHIIEDCNGADDDRGGDVEKTNVWNILDPRKCSHIWCKTREPAITSSLTHALPILLIIHRVFSSTCKRKLYVFGISLSSESGREQIAFLFVQCLYHICWEPNSYLLWNKFIFSWETDPKPPLYFDVYLQCALCMSTRGIA